MGLQEKSILKGLLKVVPSIGYQPAAADVRGCGGSKKVAK
jgi:hypothetical protein